ncbi:MAG: SLC13 family permease [Bacteroidota bacterium]
MESAISFWPLWVLLLGTLSVIICIVSLRFPAFIALMIGAIVVGILGQTVPEGTNGWIAAVETSMREFGVTAGKVSFVIAIASILGIALTESGAAERIVNRLIRLFGEANAGIALLVAGFILSIPVFFDTVFFLLVPLAIVLAQKTGKNFTLFVMAIGCGAVITHSVVPPTPGPLLMAEDFKLDMGFVILAGILSGILPAFVGYKYSQRTNVRLNLTPPDFAASSDEEAKKLPTFGLSILPILLPLLLIIGASVVTIFYEGPSNGFTQTVTFLGNKNIAMFLGLLVALYLWAKQKGLDLKALGGEMERPLEIAGLIILITSAGGAFGAMIRNTGIGEMIQNLSSNGFSLNLIIVAWLMAAVLKFAQGSSTVAIITTAGIMTAIIGTAADLGYHTIYLFMAIGYGAMTGSWMNDSGFWIVGKLSGLNEQQTLRVWSFLLAVIGVVGGVQTLLLSYLLPMI